MTFRGLDQSVLTTPVWVHQIDLMACGAMVTTIGDLAPVWGPGRIAILEISIGSQPSLVGSVRSHDIDLEVPVPPRLEYDLGTVR